MLGVNATETPLTGGDLKQAAVVFDPNSGKPQVELTFTPAGAKKFADITKRNVGKILAIALDEQLVQAPRVNEAIFGGSAVITGDFSTDEAKVLQIQLNAGALPVSLSVLEQHAIGATLGQESLQKSLVAGVLGFFVIVLFMIFLYGRLGVIASLALIVYALIVLALFRLIPVTLTLAGIAGFILSIGIAVDANILIFERMKEEMRLGKSRAMAIDIGFSRAWLSIRDSNIASLITSAILYYFGTGIVKGFAFTLALGVLVSMFSAIFVTRMLLKVFYKK
jgi:preprotein translocase subunit SecD